MEKWVIFLQSNSEILTGTAIIVLGLILTIILARVLRQIKRLNRNLSSITKNVQAYFDVIMQEEASVQEIPQKAEQQQRAVEQEIHSVEGESSIEQERRKQEEEVFNAVLQEYFS